MVLAHDGIFGKKSAKANEDLIFGIWGLEMSYPHFDHFKLTDGLPYRPSLFKVLF